MAERHLPGHIAAALAAAGGATDSAGRDWAGRDLSGSGNPLHNFDQDDGLADAGYAAAVQRLVAGSGTEEDIVRALATARVFVPVVATLGEAGDAGHGVTADKSADMALVTLRAPDGRAALPVFSAVDRLRAWHSQARPVAVYAARAALSAVADGSELLVVDPGADYTFVVRRPAVWALGQQREWLPSYRDPALADLLSEAASGEPDLLGVTAAPGAGIATRNAAGDIVAGGGPGPELRMILRFHPDTPQAKAQEAAARIHRSLAGNRDFVERVDSVEMKITR